MDKERKVKMVKLGDEEKPATKEDIEAKKKELEEKEEKEKLEKEVEEKKEREERIMKKIDNILSFLQTKLDKEDTKEKKKKERKKKKKHVNKNDRVVNKILFSRIKWKILKKTWGELLVSLLLTLSLAFGAILVISYTPTLLLKVSLLFISFIFVIYLSRVLFPSITNKIRILLDEELSLFYKEYWDSKRKDHRQEFYDWAYNTLDGIIKRYDNLDNALELTASIPVILVDEDNK